MTNSRLESPAFGFDAFGATLQVMLFTALGSNAITFLLSHLPEFMGRLCRQSHGVLNEDMFPGF